MPRKNIKKDFNRDQMYSKIMPSMQGEMEPAAIVADPATRSAPEPEPPRARAATDAEYPLLHNYMEDLLVEKMEHTMKVLRSCGCDRCKKDILALALNALPPVYAVVARDETTDRVKQLRREYEVKVTAVLIKAIQQVKNEPRH